MENSHNITPKIVGIRLNIHFIFSIFIAIFILGILYIRRESIWCNVDQRILKNGDRSSLRCNLFFGKWVYDNKSYPLYTEKNCSYQFNGLTCERSGRKDLNYQFWRWQPHNCDLPRFNALAMLERLRGKRLVFVGDSLTRNQWASLVCLLESPIPKDLKDLYADGNFATMKITEYNASVEHYWAPYLVESNSDDPVVHPSSTKQIVKLQAIENHARQWINADILVFNSYLWWQNPIMNVLWGSLDVTPEKIYKEDDRLRIFKKALKTWSNWLEIHVNRSNTQLFFVSMVPTHERAEEWGNAAGQNCYNETEQIFKEGYWGNSTNPKMMRIVEEVIDDLKMKGLEVQILNITQLSQYRKEAHPSIYYWKFWKPHTKEELANPPSYSDCVHWCLPGVPDVWNEFLYAYISHSVDLKEKRAL